MSNKIKKSNSFLSGLLFGSLIGGTVALLFAPNTGEETRTVIKEKSAEIKDKAVESGNEIRQKSEEVVQKTVAQIEEKAGAAKEKAMEIGQQSQTFIDEQREKIKGAIDAGKKSLAKNKDSEVETAVENGVEAVSKK